MRRYCPVLFIVLLVALFSLSGCGPSNNNGVYPFFDGFESATNWTATGLWHRQVNDPTIVNTADPLYLPTGDTSGGRIPSAYAGDYCYWYGDPATGNYVTGDRTVGSLTSPWIDLTSAVNPVLTFWSWFEVEGLASLANEYDQMIVRISTNGVDFDELARLNPGTAWDSNQPYTSGGFNVPGIWVRESLDLGAYTGQTVRIRFTFDSDDEQYNFYRGWFIDDVSVAED